MVGDGGLDGVGGGGMDAGEFGGGGEGGDCGWGGGLVDSEGAVFIRGFAV